MDASTALKVAKAEATADDDVMHAPPVDPLSGKVILAKDVEMEDGTPDLNGMTDDGDDKDDEKLKKRKRREGETPEERAERKRKKKERKEKKRAKAEAEDDSD